MAFVFAQLPSLTAGVDTELKTVPALSNAIYDINICKTTLGDAIVDLSVTAGLVTTLIEKGATVSFGTPLVRTKEMFPPGAIIKVLSNVSGVDVTLSGIEEEV